jgi:hypothetical protein
VFRVGATIIGILLSIAVGIAFGWKLQEGSFSYYVSQQSAADPHAKTVGQKTSEAETATEQELNTAMREYIIRISGSDASKNSWESYIEDYRIHVKGTEVFIAIRTGLTGLDSKSLSILNAVQEFMKTRLPKQYKQAYIAVLNENGVLLADRKVSL